MRFISFFRLFVQYEWMREFFCLFDFFAVHLKFILFVVVVAFADLMFFLYPLQIHVVDFFVTSSRSHALRCVWKKNWFATTTLKQISLWAPIGVSKSDPNFGPNIVQAKKRFFQILMAEYSTRSFMSISACNVTEIRKIASKTITDEMKLLKKSRVLLVLRPGSIRSSSPFFCRGKNKFYLLMTLCLELSSVYTPNDRWKSPNFVFRIFIHIDEQMNDCACASTRPDN